MYPVMQYAKMVARTSGITVDPATPPMIGANTTVLCVCVKERGGGGGGGGRGDNYKQQEREWEWHGVYDSHIPRLSCAWE